MARDDDEPGLTRRRCAIDGWARRPRTRTRADLTLDEVQLTKLDAVSRVELGFPRDFLSNGAVLDLVRGEVRTKIDGR